MGPWASEERTLVTLRWVDGKVARVEVRAASRSRVGERPWDPIAYTGTLWTPSS